MIYHCCDKLRRDAVAAAPDAQRHRLSRGDRSRSVAIPIHCGNARCWCIASSRCRPAPMLTRCGSRAASESRISGWTGRHRPRRMPAPLSAPGEADDRRDRRCRCRTPPRSSSCASARRGRLFDLHAAPGGVRADDRTAANFDPQLAAIDFSLQGRLPVRLRLRAGRDLSAATRDAARHQLSRQGLCDASAGCCSIAWRSWCRNWRRASAADYGIALVELLAYVGDQLSYQQDAIATEAYLGTARRRISLRRHALLVDYPDARRLQCAGLAAASAFGAGSLHAGKDGTQFLTRCPGFPARHRQRLARKLDDAMLLTPLVFEPLARRRRCTRRTTRCRSTPGAISAAACREAPPAPRWPGHCRTSSRATPCCSRKCWDRTPASSATPMPAIATSCG